MKVPLSPFQTWPSINRNSHMICATCNFLIIYWSILQASWRRFQGPSLDLGCLSFCSLSEWSHFNNVEADTVRSQSSTASFPLCVFSIRVCFYCTGRVFGTIVILKHEAIASQMVPILTRSHRHHQASANSRWSAEGPDAALRSCVRPLLEFSQHNRTIWLCADSACSMSG